MRFNAKWFGLILLGGCLLNACTDNDPTTSPVNDVVACSPLDAVSLPITMGAVVAVGKASDGTLYVVEQPLGGTDSELRVFVSNGSKLERVRVTGSGSGSTDGKAFLVFQFELPGDGGTANLGLSGQVGAYDMAYVSGELAVRSYEDILAAGEQLTREDETVIDDLTVSNLAGEIVVEYNAQAADGARLVVLRPRDDWSYEDFRAFYGEGNELIECRVDSVTRLRDGGTTTVVFELNGKVVTALFPASLTGNADAPTLTVDNESSTLTVLESTEGLSFSCLKN